MMLYSNRDDSGRSMRLSLSMVLMSLLLPVSAWTQGSKPAAKPAQKPQTEKTDAAPAKKVPLVRVSKEAPFAISIKADDIPITEVTSVISSKLKVPVYLSELMRKQKVTLDFERLTLEPAMKILAPQVYVDYEYSGDAAVQPKALAVYLYAYNETPPALNATVRSNSETLMIEGNTEDSTDPAAAATSHPLEVKVDKRLVTVKSTSQPLTVVLAELATSLGIPFELRFESKEIVNTSFDSYRIEDAIQLLSPNIRLYQRSDLQRAESIPLRLVLVAPAKS